MIELKQLDRVAIGKRIQTVRKSANISQEKLAEILKVNPKYISQVECGTKTFSLDRFAEVCQLFGVASDYLLFGKTSDNSQFIPGMAEAIGTLSPERQEFVKEAIIKSNFFL